MNTVINILWVLPRVFEAFYGVYLLRTLLMRLVKSGINYFVLFLRDSVFIGNSMDILYLIKCHSILAM